MINIDLVSQMRTYTAADPSAGIAPTKASEPYKPTAGRGGYKKKGRAGSFSKAKGSSSEPARKKKASSGSRSSIGRASSSKITSFAARQPNTGSKRGGSGKGRNRGAGAGSGRGGMSAIGMMPT